MKLQSPDFETNSCFLKNNSYEKHSSGKLLSSNYSAEVFSQLQFLLEARFVFFYPSSYIVHQPYQIADSLFVSHTVHPQYNFELNEYSYAKKQTSDNNIFIHKRIDFKSKMLQTLEKMYTLQIVAASISLIASAT